MKALTQCMQEAGMTLEGLMAATGLELQVVRAIASGNYTASPSQRESISAALNVAVNEIAWDHSVPVQHLYGHGPQFGRTP